MMPLRFDVALSLWKLGGVGLLASLCMLEWRVALAALGVMLTTAALTFGPLLIDKFYFERRLRQLEARGSTEEYERVRQQYIARLKRGLGQLRGES